MLRLMLLILGFAALPFPVQAVDYISEHIPQAAPVGEGRLSVFIFDVYDATLWAPQGDFTEQGPFALKLSYLRDIKGRKIAERSIEEMKNIGMQDQEKLERWYQEMLRIFPDVQQGTSLTGVYTDEGHTIFYWNSDKIGVVEDEEFGKYFFDIWLSRETSAPDLRKKLLGIEPAGGP